MTIRALLLSFALVFAAPPLSAGETVRFGTEGEYPPFNTVDASGTLSGFDIDIARALCAEMTTECLFIVAPWDELIPGLESNRFDAVVASLSITEERQKSVAFTDPYYSNKLRFVAQQDGSFGSDSNSVQACCSVQAALMRRASKRSTFARPYI